MRLGDSRLAFEATLATLRAGAYAIRDLDEARLFLRARAKIGEDVVRVSWGAVGRLDSHANWLSFQVYPDGSLGVSAYGYHVRNDGKEIDKYLAAEIDKVLAAIATNADRMRPGATAR